jgi:SAM-dependent methyltransferase
VSFHVQTLAAANLYDYPKYYDLIFGSDWKSELEFLESVFRQHARRPVRRVFEPACGTGRLLYRLAKRGYEVSGLDLNPAAVAYCNRRLARHGSAPTARVGDMSDFRLPRQVDAAFNMINSFRHLPTEAAAHAHLACLARSLAPGGVYVLGLHLTPTRGEPIEEESWSSRRGNLCILSELETTGRDLRRRVEAVFMRFDIYTPSRTIRLTQTIDFRTYTARQMSSLLRRVEAFELAATYDFAYRTDQPIRVGPETEDVVYVLRKK